MGKDDKQRRKGNAQGASSSRAAELLQKSGINVNFLGFNAADAALNPGDLDEQDDYVDLDAKVRVIFRKFGKREANTREKALKGLAEVIVEDEDTYTSFKPFVAVYSKLAFDPSTAVRIAVNNCLEKYIKTFKSKIASDVVTVLPLVLLSTFDHITAVKRSAADILETCFDDEKREKIYQQFPSKTIDICLEIIKRRHNLLGPQKFEDLENYSQRCDRLITQSLGAVDSFIEKYDKKKEIFKVLVGEFDKLSGMGPQLQSRLMKVFLVYMKLESLEDVLKTSVCGKIVKLMDSPHESVSQHAFSCYLYMANAVGSGQKGNFSLKDFVCVPVLRMVARKASHYKSLEHCLLPLVIIVIKNAEDQPELKAWIKSLLNSFFEGEMPSNVFLSWAKALSDVIEMLNLKYLEKEYDEEVSEWVENSVVRFLQIYLTKEEDDIKENDNDLDDVALKLVLRQCSEIGEKKVEDVVNMLLEQLFYNLPKSQDFILKIWEKRDDEKLKTINFWLQKQILEGDAKSTQLFTKFLEDGCYKSMKDLDYDKLVEGVMDTICERKEITEVLFKTFVWLVKENKVEAQELFEVVDVSKLKHTVKLMLLCFDEQEYLFSDVDRERIVTGVLIGLVQNATLLSIEKMPEALHFWISHTLSDNMYKVLGTVCHKYNVALLAKVIIVISKVDGISFEFLDDLSQVLIDHIVDDSFTEYPDENDKLDLDWFLSQHQKDSAKLQKVFEYETVDFKDIVPFYSEVAHGFDGIKSILNMFESTSDELLAMSKDLDSCVAFHILAKEPLAHCYALSFDRVPDSESDDKLNDEYLKKGLLYMSLKPDSITSKMLLHSILLYSANYAQMDYVYCDSFRSVLLKHMNMFEKVFESLTDDQRNNVIKAAVDVYFGKTMSFTFIYGLRRLLPKWSNLYRQIEESKFSLQHKMAIKAGINVDFVLYDAELIEKHEHLPFIVSLERKTYKLRESSGNEDVAVISLAEIKEKVDQNDIDWLFTATGDIEKDLLSCSVLRLSIQLAGRLPELPQELRDFVLCGLITSMQDFTAKESRAPLLEVLATLALEFFTSYDRKLSDKLSELKSLPDISEDLLANKMIVQGQIQEWREFFGSSASNYAFAWFCWLTVGGKERSDAWKCPSFLRVQLCKTIRNTFLDLNMQELVSNPSSLCATYMKDKDTVTKDEIFDSFVTVLSSSLPELQLTAVFLLQNLILTHFTTKDEIDEQLSKMLLTSESTSSENEEATDTQRNTVEYKLSKFFDDLSSIVVESDDQDSIDYAFVVWDLLIRTVKLLDSQQSAEFCAQLSQERIGHMFGSVIQYLPLGMNKDDCVTVINRRPDDVLSFWKTPFTVDKSRMVKKSNYALWLYYRSLETLPALVRDWVSLLKNDKLKKFTAISLSPILIEEEFKKVGNVKKKTGFSVRSRTATKEIVARYQVEELTLETIIKLPDDYPLSQVTIVHDKRNIISKGMTHKLHLNLFSYVNTRNGAICDAVLQWKKNVEKQLEGVEDCAICMMTVSSRNYRMPDLKCRQCTKKFHSDCMLKWIQTSTAPTCPLCRNEFY
ncbi:unnamed protein product [Bursaphelenchus okinawaensis]|uniref:E3 ubiquitin-protein ligase listerin n=1 Tax=Bursaphelenchus okinawaensis TaxID=465554 RepID=A0A811LNN0_9BILA|nr:unnamed protein product [Bursaphelenchus okinawaensis]CAG9125613.1 unnamed protein product [Bursaphelenchus okinawaensis]